MASAGRRLVIVAENSLLVEAIRLGFRRDGEFDVVGRANPGRTSAQTILGASPHVILIDDMDRDDIALELLRALQRLDATVPVVVLTMQPEAWWLRQLFDAGASCAISKATPPEALATLVRESLAGHIFHRHPEARGRDETAHPALPGDDLPLTEREREILQLVASGATNGNIARCLWVTEQTVKFHLRNIYRKLDVANRTQASQVAFLNGLATGLPGVVKANAGDLTVAS